MLAKGNNYLNDALVEIDNGKDTTAFVFISQGKTLFDEVKLRGQELLEQRTQEEYEIYVNKLMQAASLLIDASRRTGSLVFYIGKETESEFEALLNEIKERKNIAHKLIEEIKSFILSS